MKHLLSPSSQNARQALEAIGVVCDGQTCRIPTMLRNQTVLPWCNIEGMQLHLAEITARVTPGKHCALLVD